MHTDTILKPPGQQSFTWRNCFLIESYEYKTDVCQECIYPTQNNHKVPQKINIESIYTKNEENLPQKIYCKNVRNMYYVSTFMVKIMKKQKINELRKKGYVHVWAKNATGLARTDALRMGVMLERDDFIYPITYYQLLDGRVVAADKEAKTKERHMLSNDGYDYLGVALPIGIADCSKGKWIANRDLEQFMRSQQSMPPALKHIRMQK